MNPARRIVAGIVAVVGAATVLGWLDRYVWIFEIADFFRLQYVVVLVAAALGAVVLRRPRLAVAALAFAVLNILVVGIPFRTAGGAASQETAGSLRVVVANVEAGKNDYRALERLTTETNPELVGVVELTPKMAQLLRAALPRYRMRVLRARDDAYGIGVFSRVPLLSARIVHLPAGGPPTVGVRVRVAGEPVTVVVTHIHTPFAGSIHLRQLQALAAARPYLGKRLVVCGDFNSPPWSGLLQRFAAHTHLHDLYADDAWRAYSWPTWNWALRVPIDNCFVSEDVAVRDHHDGPDIGSDHFPLIVDLVLIAGSTARSRPNTPVRPR